MEENNNKVIKVRVGNNGRVIELGNDEARINALRAEFSATVLGLTQTIEALQAKVNHLQEIIDNYDEHDDNPDDSSGNN